MLSGTFSFGVTAIRPDQDEHRMRAVIDAPADLGEVLPHASVS